MKEALLKQKRLEVLDHLYECLKQANMKSGEIFPCADGTESVKSLAYAIDILQNFK